MRVPGKPWPLLFSAVFHSRLNHAVVTKEKPIELPILNIRGQRVMLDSDLAGLYGTSTKRLNQALKRNTERFPDDFAFQLTAGEYENLRSRIAGVGLQAIESEEENKTWSQTVTRSSKDRGITYRPWVFTEHGALMAANILRSEQAVLMSIYVVRAFVKQREQAAANAVLFKRLAEIDKGLLRHDSALRDIYRKLLPLLQPEPVPRKRGIGFVLDGD